MGLFTNSFSDCLSLNQRQNESILVIHIFFGGGGDFKSEKMKAKITPKSPENEAVLSSVHDEKTVRRLPIFF